ncbi:hypothetical protein DWB61_01825 [Ancylomarina euxinus]|uniref:DUF6398 domain-containing protein n=1 Tax=Ancylomarina euxinus TaxID=2283627 RepID=A0A425Y8X0_9BACT|nr:DUF6398 domain-containing protein [Ancylomarina euxinus]MCZ4693351.1 DUF6398 domain-containing protein [Ancylomarina euxinus]MUP13579.1 hypothetical protein [Ancylomarina euxinus]RRG24774.1 hypothetical protein DWB61_01825 [Ancylomarina euxinus]
MSSKIEIIKELLNNFGNEVLKSKEYAEICLKILSKLEKHPDKPMLSGQENIWAASIVHAVGSINFLFHSKSTPSISKTEFNQHFGTSSKVIEVKSIQIQDLLHLSSYNTQYLIKASQHDNPIDKIKEVIIKKFGVSEAEVEEILKHAGHPDCPIIPKSDYSALTIIPKQKFWDWVATQTNIDDLSHEMKTDFNIYLIPDIELESSLEEELHENFEEIFKIELARYIKIDSKFPEVNFMEFLQWFDVKSSSHVMDLTGELLDDFDDEDFFDDDLGPKDKNKPPDFSQN